jgi:epoxyqueuosine reductase
MLSWKNLDNKLKKLNAKFMIVSNTHLKELQEEIENLNQNGKINPEIYKDYIKPFQYKLPEFDGPAGSVIVIAVPQGISIVIFKLNGKDIKTIIPPTYLFSKVRKKCISILSEIFGNNTDIKRALLPLKLLAARSGLGRYGRNHLCYVNDMGSFTRLEAFYIPHLADRDDWQHEEMLQQCENCVKCVTNCPTQCIKHDEIVINAARCITHINENEGEFPQDLHPEVHNALVGCIKCQAVCPVNRPYLKDKTVIETFSEEETGLILGNRIHTSDVLADKLRQMDMDEYQSVFSRNLKALLKI